MSFVEYIYGIKPEGQRDDAHRKMIDELSVKYLQEERKNGDDLFNFLQSIKHRAPTTQHKWNSVIDQWLTLNDTKLKRVKTKLPRNKITIRDIELSRADIKTIFDHMSLVSHAILIQKCNTGIINGKSTDQTRDG